jgi:membrane protein YqaA with SNARE-associated domain
MSSKSRQLYLKMQSWATKPGAVWVLFGLAFLESSVFPIPPDILLIPLVLLHPSRAFVFAAVCTLGSVLGGIVGYGIGMFLWGLIGQGIIAFYGLQEGFATLQSWFNDYDVFIVGAAGFSPIPYKVFTLLSGVMGTDLWAFIMASVISRGARFFLIAWLLWRGGRAWKGWIENHFYPLTMAATVALILTFLLFKFVMQV